MSVEIDEGIARRVLEVVDAARACIGCGSLMLSHGEFCAVCRTALAAYAARTADSPSETL